MIPDELIEKAKSAYNRCGKVCSRDSLVAALEAVAAEIWDDGRAAGWGDYLADDLDDWAGNTTQTPNPYRASED